MIVWYALGGLVVLAAGISLLLLMLAGNALRAGFGDGAFSNWWYAIPAVLILAGPAIFWVMLPLRKRDRGRRRTT